MIGFTSLWIGDILIDCFHQFGNIYLGYFYASIFSMDHGVSLCRAIIFGSYLLCAFLLYRVLEGLYFIDKGSRLFIVLIFSILPVNSARIALSCSFLALGYLAFFIGIWLTSKYMASKSAYIRVIALATYLISLLLVNSLFVFYGIVALYILFMGTRGKINLENLIIVVRSNADFFLLPFIAWVIRYTYFMPYGIYAEYNIIDFHSLINMSQGLVMSTLTYVRDVFVQSFAVSAISLLPVTLFVFLLIIIALKSNISTNEKYSKELLVLGFIFFILGIFPYFAVGKVPTLDDWGSRHALLLPLGISFIIYYSLTLISKILRLGSFSKIAIISILLASFSVYNLSVCADFQLDANKQSSMIADLKGNEMIKNNTTFLFVDNTRELNANKRVYRFYEYTSMMKYAFGDETRFGCDAGSFKNILADLAYSAYGFSDYVPRDPQGVIVISYNKPYRDMISNRLMMYKLMLTQTLNPKAFSKPIKLTQIEFKAL